MTDLISSLAESIVALINAKPQSPTKDEVEAVLRAACTPILRADAIDPAKFKNIGPGTIIPLPYKEPSAEMMKLMEAVRSYNGPYAWTPCPGSTDGSHSWKIDEYKRGNGERVAHLYRCACGATKL